MNKKQVASFQFPVSRKGGNRKRRAQQLWFSGNWQLATGNRF
jgi:hypothetical protein